MSWKRLAFQIYSGVLFGEDHVDEEPGLIFGKLNGKTHCAMLESGFFLFQCHDVGVFEIQLQWTFAFCLQDDFANFARWFCWPSRLRTLRLLSWNGIVNDGLAQQLFAFKYTFVKANSFTISFLSFCIFKWIEDEPFTLCFATLFCIFKWIEDELFALFLCALPCIWWHCPSQKL